MGERSERPAVPLRLVLDFGESVELDGSTVYDPVAEAAVPAVVLRMPAHRAAWFGGCCTRTRGCVGWRASSWTRPRRAGVGVGSGCVGGRLCGDGRGRPAGVTSASADVGGGGAAGWRTSTT